MNFLYLTLKIFLKPELINFQNLSLNFHIKSALILVTTKFRVFFHITFYFLCKIVHLNKTANF